MFKCSVKIRQPSVRCDKTRCGNVIDRQDWQTAVAFDEHAMMAAGERQLLQITCTGKPAPTVVVMSTPRRRPPAPMMGPRCKSR
jgi:hypothetical protein